MSKAKGNWAKVREKAKAGEVGGAKKANGEDKTVWYQDLKGNKSGGQRSLAQGGPFVMGNWVAGPLAWKDDSKKNNTAKAAAFLLLCHSGGVQIALKERNAGEFYWRSPKSDAGYLVQPSGAGMGAAQQDGSKAKAASDTWNKVPKGTMPPVTEFDRLLNIAAKAKDGVSGREGDIETLGFGKSKYGRSGTFWEVEFQKNSAVRVTNSSKGLKGTAFAIELGRIGNLTFTDDGGRTYGLADHDELSRVKLDKERKENSAAARKERSDAKKAKQKKAAAKAGGDLDKQDSVDSGSKAGKKGGKAAVGGGKKGGVKAGGAKAAEVKKGKKAKKVSEPEVEEEEEPEAWICEVCSTRGNFGDKCETCKRPRGHQSVVADTTAKRTLEEAQVLRAVSGDVGTKAMSVMDSMGEGQLRTEIQRRMKTVRGMLTEKGAATAMEVLTEYRLAVAAEVKLEALILDREAAEAEMSYLQFVCSAKRLKRERGKPRKRKLQEKLIKLDKTIEKIRSQREQDQRDREDGTYRKKFPLVVRILFCCCIACCCRKKKRKTYAEP